MENRTVKDVLEEINWQISTAEAVEIVESFYDSYICMSDDYMPIRGKNYDSYQLKKLLQELLNTAQKEYNFKT
jgi:hypothetical protein